MPIPCSSRLVPLPAAALTSLILPLLLLSVPFGGAARQPQSLSPSLRLIYPNNLQIISASTFTINASFQLHLPPPPHHPSLVQLEIMVNDATFNFLSIDPAASCSEPISPSSLSSCSASFVVNTPRDHGLRFHSLALFLLLHSSQIAASTPVAIFFETDAQIVASVQEKSACTCRCRVPANSCIITHVAWRGPQTEEEEENWGFQNQRLKELGWVVSTGGVEDASMIVTGDVRELVFLQSCDDFLSTDHLAATSHGLGEGKGVMVSDDFREGKGVMVEWCRFRNCSLSAWRVSSSLPLPQSSTSRISACLAGGCPVAFTRDVFSSTHRPSSVTHRPSSVTHRPSSVARNLPDSSHASFSKETLPSIDSVGKEWDDLVFQEGVTFIVVPYRNRTKALGLLADRLQYVCQWCVMLVVEQGDNEEFNRGALLNVGLMLALHNNAYVCLHDVDFLPWHATASALYRGGKDAPIVHAMGRVDSLGGVVCGGSVTLSATGGYPNGFFGWGYEDHELLWRVEVGGGEAGRRHWLDDSFLWFEGYDEIGHDAVAAEGKVLQHKQNRARYLALKTCDASAAACDTALQSSSALMAVRDCGRSCRVVTVQLKRNAGC